MLKFQFQHFCFQILAAKGFYLIVGTNLKIEIKLVNRSEFGFNEYSLLTEAANDEEGVVSQRTLRMK